MLGRVKPSKVQHRILDADEAHHSWIGKNPCSACAAPARGRIQVLMMIVDLKPEIRAAIEIKIAQKKVKPTQTTYGWAVVVSVLFFCDRCRGDMERQVAKETGSNVLVWIDEPPAPRHATAQSTGIIPGGGLILPGG